MDEVNGVARLGAVDYVLVLTRSAEALIVRSYPIDGVGAIEGSVPRIVAFLKSDLFPQWQDNSEWNTLVQFTM
jgi:hypothetical protein